MTDHLREQLLGYLLGALEEDEEAVLEEQLKRDDALRQEFEKAWHSLKPLRSHSREFVPPLGLAARTCEMISEQSAEVTAQAVGRPTESTFSSPEVAVPSLLHADVAMSPAVAPATASNRWTWADLVVAASIAAAAFLLIFPAIESSRFNARMAGCQENLRQLGTALAEYSGRNGGYLPAIPPSGPMAVAGVYAPILLEDGYLDGPARVVCPGSPLATDDQFSVPTIKQLQQAALGDRLARLQRQLGGSYGYTLGYMGDGQYRPTKNLHRPRFAVMADSPSYDLPELTSLNHGGRGQNFLFEDGHVEFLPAPQPKNLLNDFFLNDTGLIAAGTHRDDAVVGSSSAVPIQVPTRVLK
ncbi:MAG: hypothetical protein HUU20_19820 [Pirellulales bacterium]|nr:hypothetical protein [Pirellulales bacterium]